MFRVTKRYIESLNFLFRLSQNSRQIRSLAILRSNLVKAKIAMWLFFTSSAKILPKKQSTTRLIVKI